MAKSAAVSHVQTSKAEILRQMRVARARAAHEQAKGRRAVAASYDRPSGRIVVELTNGFMFAFPARAIPALAKATAEHLASVTVSPGGSGLHWERLDTDLSVAGLLLSSIGRAEKASELARIAGRTRSAAKAAAARANGAKGGRPRKRGDG